MIGKINIKDYAIFDEIELSFKSGLTAITGETGSGKSILIQALSASLGKKVSKVMVKSSSEKAIINTEINNNYFRRVILKSGRSKCFLNDRLISISRLREINKENVDLHGQNDQNLIIDSSSHINFLDRFCKLDKKINRITNIYNHLDLLNNKLEKVRYEGASIKEKLELLNFQADEIDAVQPKFEEDLKLDKKYKEIINSQKIIKTLNDIENNISIHEDSAVNKLNTMSRLIESIIKYDPSLSAVLKLIKSYTIQLQELSSDISIKSEDVETDPEKLPIIEDRLKSIESLKRKYGGSVESIIQKREEINNDIIAFREINISEKKVIDEIKIKKKEFTSLAIQIHEIRISKLNQLERGIEIALENLNMPSSKFKIMINQNESEKGFVNFNNRKLEPNNKGIDQIEFFISANPGEPIKPLSEIISGGEASRIMLALKKVFQKTDPVNTLIFDEIDSGISGKTALKVAEELYNLSKFKQVICITHLSQIAFKADHHLHITKTIKKENTNIKMTYLNKIQSQKIIEDLFYSNEKENL